MGCLDNWFTAPKPGTPPIFAQIGRRIDDQSVQRHDLLQLSTFDRLFLYDSHLKQGIVGAQTKGQFHMIYGTEATQALFTGLATQIVYVGCAPRTAALSC